MQMVEGIERAGDRKKLIKNLRKFEIALLRSWRMKMINNSLRTIVMIMEKNLENAWIE